MVAIRVMVLFRRLDLKRGHDLEFAFKPIWPFRMLASLYVAAKHGVLGRDLVRGRFVLCARAAICLVVR
jgi:hypothetical protein